jgi:RsiW-degrading membrane proteinase PrsW (M82 family)
MVLLAMAIAPGVAIALYFYFRDQYNREPRRHLIISFFLGGISAVLAALLEESLFSVTGIEIGNGLVHTMIAAFLLVGFTEEWTKYIMVRYYALKQPEFDEPLDGIIYSVMVGMGFATLENVLYVMESGYTTAILRMFLSVPAHATFAVIMGYELGKAKFAGRKRWFYVLSALVGSSFWHGSYDFFLFLQQDLNIARYIPTGLLFLGAVGSLAWSIRLSRRALQEHLNLSRQSFQEFPPQP